MKIYLFEYNISIHFVIFKTLEVKSSYGAQYSLNEDFEIFRSGFFFTIEARMNKKNFDYSSYGFVGKNELSVSLHLWRGESRASVSAKAKPKLSPGIHTKENVPNPKCISASLEFTNVSSRELHIENRLWFTRLKLFANDKPVEYIGPMVSMPSPSKSDFVSLKPGEKFATEPINLNNYYGISEDFNAALKVSFQFSSEVPVAVSTLSADH